MNGQPLDAGPVGDKIEALRAFAAADLFAGFDPDHFPATTIPALELSARAYAKGERAGEAVGLALRDAVFEHGLDVSDGAVLASIATAHGLDADDLDVERPLVLADWEDGRARGVVGSPHWFCDGGDYFCPTLVITHDHGQLVVAPDEQGLETFLAGCLG